MKQRIVKYSLANVFVPLFTISSLLLLSAIGTQAGIREPVHGAIVLPQDSSQTVKRSGDSTGARVRKLVTAADTVVTLDGDK